MNDNIIIRLQLVLFILSTKIRQFFPSNQDFLMLTFKDALSCTNLLDVKLY